MTLHKLTAGSGYDYLTRQVAALDATDKGHTGLSTYYSERGEAPGVWVGSGMSGLVGLEAGDPVTSEQMSNLFAYGYHPLYDPKWQPRTREEARTDRETTWKLGRPYPIHSRDVSPFRIELARRVVALGEQMPGGVPVDVRARVRTETALEFFTAEHGRKPASERELHGFVARSSRPQTDGVSGYDLTFSPVKSVSTLWAIADPTTAAAVERAHNAAVRDALEFIERHALYSRTGAAGVRQVEVTGLVATAFTHRDSRAGDPDLHTHVAVANKVQTRAVDGAPGRWLSIDGRVLFKAKVAASETYNTRLEHHLTQSLGLRFAERDDPGRRVRGAKRSVREIVGIDADLNARWSQRRSQITARQGDLAVQFRRDHGRPPTPVEALHLAQQANLETRDRKHSARTVAEQRDTWQTQAAAVLGGPDEVRRMVEHALVPSLDPRLVVIDAAWVNDTASRVIDELEQRRATWQTWHVRAEAQRQIRAADLPSGSHVVGLFATPDDLVEQVTAAALTGHSVSLAGPQDRDHGVVEPAALRRSDGTSVYTVAGAEQFSSVRVMGAEQRLLAQASAPASAGAMVAPNLFVELALLEATANGTPLNLAQATLVHDMAISGKPLQLAIAPAGSGKTTALRALAAAWTEGGGNVLALAPSASAVAAMTDVLANVPRVHGDTLAKLIHVLDTAGGGPIGQAPDWVDNINPGTLVLIDEAGMADTLTLDQVTAHVIDRGGQVRLIGDDQQLSAIGAGGVLRDIKAQAGAIHLDELMRFTDPAEAHATMALREGDLVALDFYESRDRIHIGDQHSIADTLHAGWHRDRADGLDALMVAPTRDQVAELNRRAQHTLFPEAGRTITPISDGNDAGVGDVVITRTNDRRLRLAGTDWVKNGDRWKVTGLGDDGSLQVCHSRSGLTTRLPAAYVSDSVELGYATTIHVAQGTTVDTVHGLAAGTETRQDLYTMLTRGRHRNDIYLAAGATAGDPHDLITPEAIHPQTAQEILIGILQRDGAATSATTQLQRAHDPALLFGQATDRYADALAYASEDVVGAATISAIEAHATALAPDITDALAWPTLRARLISLEADGHEAVGFLHEAAQRGQLIDAVDPAAVLTWRIQALTTIFDPSEDDTTASRIGPRTPIPRRLFDHPEWGRYLEARQELAQHFSSQLLSAEPAPDPSTEVASGVRSTPQPAPALTPEHARPRGPGR